MSNADKIRQFLIEEIQKDAIGPLMGEEEEWIERERPQTRYFSGVLYPKKTPFKADDQLKNTNADGGDDEEEDDEPSSFSFAVGTKPSSLGLSCQIPDDVEKINVEINFGKYFEIPKLIKPKKKEEEVKEKEEILPADEYSDDPGWKRRSFNQSFSIEIKETPKAELSLSGKNEKGETVDENAKIQWKITEIKNKRRTIDIFLMNTSNPILEEEFTKDSDCIFQPSIRLTGEDGKNIFLAIEDIEDKFFEDRNVETKKFQLLFRNKKYFANGHNCSVKWSDEIISNCVKRVETTLLPEYHVEDIAPREIENNSLKLKTLKDVENFSEYEKLLEPIKNDYKEWLEEKKNQQATIPKKFIESDTVQEHLDNCDEAIERIGEGIKEIAKDNSNVGEAFRFANKVMYNQMRYSRWAGTNQRNGGKIPKIEGPTDDYEPEWRLFQLAFILLNIESVVNPKSKHRETVDLLWFPTGGGKTEAYLGIIAFNIALRRLRETGVNKYGTAVIMRYTYRLLTLQQFQRAAALMCACEYERQNNKTKWGDEPFSVGLFVGMKTTPNDLKTAEENLADYKFSGIKPEEGNPVQITSCPWCGTEIGPNEYPMIKDSKKHYHVPGLPRRMRIRCKNSRCFFGNKDKKDSYLPLVFIDEDINSTLPTLLIGTVDKFARLSWQSYYCSIFGKVNQYCKQHGFRPSTTPIKEKCSHTKPEWKVINIKTSLPPPELIIQDELHLISGPLGTLVGLYETAIDALCEREGIKPKIIASTATVKNSDNQIKWLFGRKKSKIFPPQVFDFGDTYFSEIIPTSVKKGRIHLGVCATSVGGYTVDARIAALVLRKARYLIENKDKLGYTTKDLDPYFTLVSYYNTIKNVGAANNMYDDSVPNFMGTIRKVYEKDPNKTAELNLNKTELTGRIDAGSIPTVLKRLETPLEDKTCECEEAIREKQEKDLCDVCGKSTKRALDALLCTNMLSVGVDVSRLSLMLINGMPKHYSEYIQASGRIGRSAASPGLVITNYTYLRARDLSIFENFNEFHSRYHMMVEPGTLTPFAARARDTGLFGVLVALVRNMADEQNGCRAIAEKPYKFKDDNQDLICLLDKIRETIQKRVNNVDRKELEDTVKQLEDKIKIWHTLAEFDDIPELKYKRNYFRFGKNSEHDVFLLKRIGDVDQPGKEGQFVPDSLRQAEGNIPVYYQPEKEKEKELEEENE